MLLQGRGGGHRPPDGSRPVPRRSPGSGILHRRAAMALPHHAAYRAPPLLRRPSACAFAPRPPRPPLSVPAAPLRKLSVVPRTALPPPVAAPAASASTPPSSAAPAGRLFSAPAPPSASGPRDVADMVSEAALLPRPGAAAPPALDLMAPVSKEGLPMKPARRGLGTICVVNSSLDDVSSLRVCDVSISPQPKSRATNTKVLNELLRLYGKTAPGSKLPAYYDGRKWLHTIDSLPFTSKEFVVTLVDQEDENERSERNFKITIRIARRTHLYHLKELPCGKQRDIPQITLQLFDVDLRELTSCKPMILSSSLFCTDRETSHQSMFPKQLGFCAHIDASATSFYNHVTITKLVEALLSLCDTSPPLSDGDHVRDGFDSKSKKVFSEKKKSREMRRKLLKELILRLKTSMGDDGSLITRGYRKVIKKTVSRLARRLKKLRRKMKYHNSSEENIQPPICGQSMLNKEKINGEPIDNWSCLNFSSMCTEEVNNFCMDLVHLCNDTGMVVNPHPCVEVTSASPQDIQAALRDVHRRATQKLHQHGKENQLQLLIVILPEIAGSYAKVKRICETDIGISSQCCLPKRASCSNKQYLVDVAMEIYYKFAGQTTVLERAFTRNAISVSEDPTIFSGADEFDHSFCLIQFGGDKTELHRAFTRNATVISEAPTIFSGADVAHYPPGGDISSPSAGVTVCFCEYEVPMPIDPGTTTVLQLVKSALMKLKIRASDFSLRFNGRTLDGSLMVNSIPALKGSRILVYPRMRGGRPVNYMLQYEQLDVIINNNKDKLSYHVTIPNGFKDANDKDGRATFLDELPRYILHQLLVMVCSEGHLNKKCYNGQFDLSTILMSRCGHMRFSSRVCSYDYTDEGGEADYQQLLDIAMVFVDIKRKRYPLHLKNLLWVLRNAPAALRRELKFVAFLINHPCLLTFAERLMLYDLVNAFVYKLLNNSVTSSATTSATSATAPATSSATATATSSATATATASADISALIAWLIGAGKGWHTIVENLMSTQLYSSYIRDAAAGAAGVLVPKYKPGLDHGLRLGRNYVGHRRNEVRMDEVEASFSYLLEFILTEVLYGLSKLLTGSNATDFISLVSDPRAHRTTVRAFCRWPVPVQSPRCERCGAQSPRCERCGAQSATRCVYCGAQSAAKCLHCGEAPEDEAPEDEAL